MQDRKEKESFVFLNIVDRRLEIKHEILAGSQNIPLSC